MSGHVGDRSKGCVGNVCGVVGGVGEVGFLGEYIVGVGKVSGVVSGFYGEVSWVDGGVRELHRIHRQNEVRGVVGEVGGVICWVVCGIVGEVISGVFSEVIGGFVGGAYRYVAYPGVFGGVGGGVIGGFVGGAYRYGHCPENSGLLARFCWNGVAGGVGRRVVGRGIGGLYDGFDSWALNAINDRVNIGFFVW